MTGDHVEGEFGDTEYGTWRLETAVGGGASRFRAGTESTDCGHNVHPITITCIIITALMRI